MQRLRPAARLTTAAGFVLASLSSGQVQSGDPRFVEITDASGISTGGYSYSCAWGDYDRDGRSDLYVSYVDLSDTLYRNTGAGSFQNVTASAGIQDPPNSGAEGVAWADVDNDGDLDLFVANGCEPVPNDPSAFYVNNGDGTLRLATAEAGLSYTATTQGTAWADYDKDGFVDLYVGLLANAVPNIGNLLYRNNRNGTFTNAALAAGTDDKRDSNGGVAWGDYDNDDDPDVVVANRFAPNALFRNNGNGTFTDVAAAAGVADDAAGNHEGVAWGDYDNDGWLDLFVADASQNKPSQLYRNNGNGTFSAVTQQAHVDGAGAGVGVNWADFDNDGWLDLFVVNAGVTAPNHLFRNLADGTFVDVAQDAGLAFKEHGRAGAAADFDGDGFLDLFICNYFGSPHRLLRNLGNGNHWLVVNPIGFASNRDAIGARVEVTAVTGGSVVRQIREVSAGGSRHSQDSMPVEFGLGNATVADVVVKFPRGFRKEITGVPANRSVTVRDAFSDEPLTAVAIKGVHLAELRVRVNIVRGERGLSPFSWTDPALTAGATSIKAQHIQEIRTALDQAYAAAGRALPTYTDPTIVAGSTLIKAVHIAELRSAVVALE